MNTRTLSGVLSLCTLLLAIVIAIPGVAGEKKITRKDVPAAVLKAFEQAYPGATVKAYGQETEHGTTYYELETVEGTVKRDLLYSADGKAVEIEETVAMKDLPLVVAKAFAKESPSVQPAKIEKTTKGDKVVYDFAMGKGRTELVIDQTGAVLKHSQAVQKNKEKEKEEDEQSEHEH